MGKMARRASRSRGARWQEGKKKRRQEKKSKKVDGKMVRRNDNEGRKEARRQPEGKKIRMEEGRQKYCMGLGRWEGYRA